MKWTKKTMTWGDYLKFYAIASGIATIIGVIISFISWCTYLGVPNWCYTVRDTVTKPFKWVKSKFKKES